MRPGSLAAGASCALALALVVPVVPAAADKPARPRRSLAECTTFDQADKGDAAVELTVRNGCSVPVACTVTWTVVCAPASRSRRASHPGERVLALVEGAAASALVSAEVCGDDAWAIGDIRWTCAPSGD